MLKFAGNRDVTAIQDLKQVINRCKQKGKTIVIAEYRLYYLMDVADCVLYMKNVEIDRDMMTGEFKKMSL